MDTISFPSFPIGVCDHGHWDAGRFFRRLNECNRLARTHDFRFFTVSDLQGFEDAVNAAQDTQAFLCVSDISDGMLQLENTPHSREVKTIFMAMRHSAQTADTANIRARCLEIMRELFRQFMSVLARERTCIIENGIILDPNIQFSEIPKYFLTGCACAYFQITVVDYRDHSFNPEEWL